ncbi:translation initiation factor IF-2 [Lyngbya aestuarii]|uniref:translation initiation factor IF-2 n=1 Tax=Lyngbya aestuarii TaxID=118322 RepID=UPI00403D94D2
MNNGKVRIYELSRELNLDNKDILSICEGLNIAVKSHSSTITESEAQSIRAAAEKYPNRPAMVGGRDSADSSQESTGSASNQSIGRANGARRQQFVELRKPKSRPSSNSGQGNPQLANPPQPPIKPQLSSPPPRSVNPERPLAQASQQEEEDTESRWEDESPTQPPSADNVSPETSSTGDLKKPKLVEPPTRPQRSKPQPAQNAVAPILKRNRNAAPDTSSSSTPTPVKPPSKPQKSSPSESPTSESRTPAAPSLPKLQEPPTRARPARGRKAADMDDTSTGIPDEDGLEEDSIETPDLLDLKLRRPSAPKLSKKKDWDEEIVEEEGKEGKGKTAKKQRRTTLFLEDEDDDFDNDAKNGADSPVKVSLSVARPPKPKSRPGQQTPTAAPSLSRAKKPGPSRDQGGGGRSESRNNRRRPKEGVAELPEKIVLSGSVTIRELASQLNIAETEIIRKLFFKGMAVSITQTLDVPTAKMVAEEMEVEVETIQEGSAATKVTEMLDARDLENLQRRPPVVTIMGHVDHGKTTLLDSIRKTKVAQGEAGGITQHIGAYHVDVEHEDKTQQVVFLDTPGHEAFTAMRARGTRVTDIAVLVVAADDGVRPQTIEAISHAKAAEVPIVVAINKTDKPEAQPDRVKQELAERGLVPEEWGGDTIMVPVSALQGENLDTLLEMILLVADIEELSANPVRPARGTVIEAHLDKARGPVASLLVQNGTLRVGDTLVAGSIFGKVRAMTDDRGEKVEAAAPSFAVELLGLSDVPAAGDEFEVFESEKEARAVADSRADQQRQSRLQQLMASRRVTLNSLSAKAQEGELKELNLILKADVQGSVEAILGSLQQLPQNEVQIRVLFAAAGEISETDIDLAAASGAVIIGFSTTLSTSARLSAEQEGVDVREYGIIYKLLDDIQGAMEGLLEPEMVEEPLGEVEVRAVFPVGRGAVAGCYVLSGKAVRNCQIRVRRGGKVVYEGNLDSLKRMKDDAREVNAGYECGVGVDKFNDWQERDIIETFQKVSKRRTLSPN